MNTRTNRSIAAVIAVVAGLGLAACSDDDRSPAEPAGQSKQNAMSAAGLVGPGCAAYAAKVPSGAGSVEGMAQDPLVTAAGNNPMLSHLSAAVSGKLNPRVNLANSLNGREYTVFAPVDDAFTQLPAATLASLKTDTPALVKLLTYHVVVGRLTPAEVAGRQMTVEGQPVDVTGSGDGLRVNDSKVICGGVKTANATVYLIDRVLTPPKG